MTELRSNLGATLEAAGSLVTAARQVETGFSVQAACSDACAARDHDEATSAFSSCTLALRTAMARDAQAIRTMAETFQEQDEALAKAMGAIE